MRSRSAGATPGHDLILQIAERVIRRADREHPADAVLRQELWGERGLEPAALAAISHAVFAYCRWLGWLEKSWPLPRQIEKAAQLAAKFTQDPKGFSDVELVARGVPSWLEPEMQIPAAWVRALQTEPKLWLRARAGQGSALAERLGDCRQFGPGPLSDILEYRGRQDLFRTPEFHEGQFELQDLSSQAVGLACAPQPGQTWWDACAGEGGKLLHLSDLMRNQGLIWASDRADWRLQKLKRRAARARVFNYRIAPWDGGSKRPTKTSFDGVLLDAPCSGIGTWQRNPHARWTTTAKDVQELSELQCRLLAHAAPAVKPGGKLVYAVCALSRSETEAVAAAFEKQCPEFQPLPLQDPLATSAPPSARLYLWPQQSGGNGMFIAAWVRKAG
jgi:16S rRNA (cytosine967-C5)-methyltransferase